MIRRRSSVAVVFILFSFATVNCMKGPEAPAGGEEEIKFSSRGVSLAGTLFLPSRRGKLPAIAVTHGSGKDTRKSAGFRSLASRLAAEGFVVLIFDKRGVGDSGGDYVETPDMLLPAGDLVEAVNFLKSRNDVDASKIGVYGHSQGGWVAPAAAAMSKDVAFVIVANGGGVSILEQDMYGYSNDLRKQGYDEASVDAAITFGRKLFTYLGSGGGYESLTGDYDVAVKQNWFDFYRNMGFTDQLPPPSSLSQPVFDFFRNIRYDPLPALQSLRVPALVILGGKDLTIPSQAAKDRWLKAYKSSGNEKLLTIEWLDNEDHYDFENAAGVVRYKDTFFDPLKRWLNGRK